MSTAFARDRWSLRSKPLITPYEIRKQLPLDFKAVQTVIRSRQTIREIIEGRDPRLLVVVGPCSIHDDKAALEYADRLADLAKSLGDRLFLVMRAYLEKPRTSCGWKGYLNDPNLDSTYKINEGLLRGRELLRQIVGKGVPVACEALELISPTHLFDLVSWSAIGARTVESQWHREMASGLPMPVGFKNTTSGGIEAACNAIKAAAQPHHFLGTNDFGQASIIETPGNACGHLVLRGSATGPNYDEKSVHEAQKLLEQMKLTQAVMVDCSHDNSRKDHRNQPLVLTDCLRQIISGNRALIGVMIESNLFEGSQPAEKPTQYGVSITDGCVGWTTTVDMLQEAYESLKRR